jgi:threonine synthase
MHAGGTPPDRLVLQVGGGAFASAAAMAVECALGAGLLGDRPRLETVQTEGGWPLARAHAQATRDFGLAPGLSLDPARLADACSRMAHDRRRYMWPWETEPRSVAHGILDDETYDWLAVMRGMLASGGAPVVVDESTLHEANRLAGETTGIPADHTGTSGLAGVLHLVRRGVIAPGENVVVIFSGVRRSGAH